MWLAAVLLARAGRRGSLSPSLGQDPLSGRFLQSSQPIRHIGPAARGSGTGAPASTTQLICLCVGGCLLSSPLPNMLALGSLGAKAASHPARTCHLRPLAPWGPAHSPPRRDHKPSCVWLGDAEQTHSGAPPPPPPTISSQHAAASLSVSAQLAAQDLSFLLCPGAAALLTPSWAEGGPAENSLGLNAAKSKAAAPLRLTAAVPTPNVRPVNHQHIPAQATFQHLWDNSLHSGTHRLFRRSQATQFPGRKAWPQKTADTALVWPQQATGAWATHSASLSLSSSPVKWVQ